MKNQRTHALGVPLRVYKFRNHVRIGIVTHAYNTSTYVKAQTSCGINYTHQEHLVNNERPMATRTSKDIDCMSCLVIQGQR